MTPEQKTEEVLASIDTRMVRLESRLVQLMIFLGANPYDRYKNDDTKPKK
jgi:hypothetical protein